MFELRGYGLACGRVCHWKLFLHVCLFSVSRSWLTKRNIYSMLSDYLCVPSRKKHCIGWVQYVLTATSAMYDMLIAWLIRCD